MKTLAAVALALGLFHAPATALAQEGTPPVPAHEGAAADEHGVTPGRQEAEPGRREHGAAEEEEKGGVAEHIFHHVSDEVVVPWHVQVGNHFVDLSITKHLINMWIAVGLMLILLGIAASKRTPVPKGGYNLLETFVMFIRDEISVKNIGDHASEYTGFLCSVFFFILFVNLCGLLPIPAFGHFPGVSTATGNLSVTVVLALFTFVMTQVAGMRAQGVVGYWAHLVPSGVPWWLYPLMIPVELLGLVSKPFALTVRLFANMVAGHIVIFFLIGLTVLISPWVAPVAVGFSLGIFMLELFVALVQAYIFTMLSALFIGMTQHAH